MSSPSSQQFQPARAAFEASSAPAIVLNAFESRRQSRWSGVYLEHDGMIAFKSRLMPSQDLSMEEREIR